MENSPIEHVSYDADPDPLETGLRRLDMPDFLEEGLQRVLDPSVLAAAPVMVRRTKKPAQEDGYDDGPTQAQLWLMVNALHPRR